MSLHVVTHSVAARYRDELEQDFKLRHKIFAERQNWKAIQRPDKRDIDQFDDAFATHLLLLENNTVIGGSRLNELTRANLTVDVFSWLIEKPFPDTPRNGADWTRFYAAPASSQTSKRSDVSAQIYCGMMEYALLQGYTFLTFVSSIYMIEIATAMGWNVSPLGMPRIIEGKPTVAAWIEVSNSALLSARTKFGITESALAQRHSTPVDDVPAHVSLSATTVN